MSPSVVIGRWLGSCLTTGLVLFAGVLVVACSTSQSLKTPLAQEVVIPAGGPQASVQWHAQVPQVGPWLAPVMGQDGLIVASSSGLVSAIDVATGKTLWSVDLKTSLLSGLGVESARAGQLQHFAVVAQNNELIYFSREGEMWRYKLGVQAITTPYVIRPLPSPGVSTIWSAWSIWWPPPIAKARWCVCAPFKRKLVA